MARVYVEDEKFRLWLGSWLADESRAAKAEAIGRLDDYEEFRALVVECAGLQVRLANWFQRRLKEPNAGDRYCGGTRPYGWTVNEAGELTEDPAEQGVIQRMIKMHRSGRSQRAIAAIMRAEGVTLSRSAVQRVFRRFRVTRASKVNRQTKAALACARRLRRVFLGLAGHSAWAAAKELNRRNIPTPAGGRWHANSVNRVRARLAGTGIAGPKRLRSPSGCPQA
jgi:hypothetical protein